MPLILAGATSGSTTIQATDAVTQTITLPNNTGTVLTTASTFAGTGPTFSATQPSAQTLTNNTWTKINVSSEEFDTANCYNTSTYRFTPNVAGYYQVNLRLNLDGGGSSGAAFAVTIWKNGSEYSVNFGASLAGGYNGSQVCEVIYMNGTTDYLEPYALQNSGSSKNLVASSNTNRFSASLVRSA